MPHNLYGDANRLRQGGAPPRDIGFRFGPPPPGGRPVPGTEVRYPATAIGVQWVPAESRWVISMDGVAAHLRVWTAARCGNCGAAASVSARYLGPRRGWSSVAVRGDSGLR